MWVCPICLEQVRRTTKAFRIANLHTLVLNSLPSKREARVFAIRQPRIIFLSFSFLVTEPLKIRHLFFHAHFSFNQHNSHNVLINRISGHLACDLIRPLVCSFWTRLRPHTHFLPEVLFLPLHWPPLTTRSESLAACLPTTVTEIRLHH
jgi:hypothetical protein